MPAAPLGRDFRLLFTSSTVSNLGDGLTLAALPLLVATLTRDPTAVAAVTLLGRLPWLALALPAGAVTDRRDRRQVMVQANVARCGVAALLAVAVAADAVELWMVYAAALLLGVAEVFHDNAAQTLLPSVVAADELPRANGRLAAGELVTNHFAGPPVGAVMFAAVAPLPFLVDAWTFMASVLLLGAMSSTVRPATRIEPTGSIVAEIGEGIAWLRDHPLLRLLAGMLALANFTYAAGYAVLVLFAQDVLGVGDVGFGLLLGAGAAGGLAGSLSVGRLRDRAQMGTLLVISATAFGVTSMTMGLMSHPVPAALVGALTGFVSVVWNVLTVSLRQALIPDELLGRVNSVYRFLGWGAIPLGALAGGVVAGAAGLRAPFVLGGVLQLAVAVVAAPRLRRAAAGPPAIGAVDGAQPPSVS